MDCRGERGRGVGLTAVHVVDEQFAHEFRQYAEALEAVHRMRDPLPVLCKSTRGSVGCGHPVDDHVGQPDNPCDCCSRRNTVPVRSALPMPRRPYNRPRRRTGRPAGFVDGVDLVRDRQR